jgi:hypothetical protein
MGDDEFHGRWMSTRLVEAFPLRQQFDYAKGRYGKAFQQSTPTSDVETLIFLRQVHGPNLVHGQRHAAVPD